MSESIIAVIPARYASTRLPGKPLVDIANKPMIQWVYERVSQCTLVHRVLVATDDDRIFECVRGFGGEAVMTPEHIPSGTDRVAFATREIDIDVVLNIQGDEPFIEPEEIDQLARLMIDNPDSVMGTLVKKISNIEELENCNTAKVVLDADGNALYFSRSAIPFFRDQVKQDQWFREHTYYKHVGIYGYRKEFLIQCTSWGPGRLERIEKLEQLRVLERGYKIKTAETSFESMCVDTPEDLKKARAWAESSLKTSQ